jgi:RimJ/RimL family protein N-acetyltransferase
MTAPTLTDGVVLLDGFKAADADAHLAGEDDEHARRFGWYPNRSTPGTVGAAIDRWRAEWEQGGRTRAFAARLDGVLVGGCELRLVSPASAELSYWTFPPFRRRGLATRAVRLVVAWATAALGVAEFELHVAPDNTASRRVAEAAGFRVAGTVGADLCYVLRAAPAPAPPVDGS